MRFIQCIFLFFLAGCVGRFAGFDELSDGTYYRMEKFGDSTHTQNPHTYLYLKYAFCANDKCQEVGQIDSVLISLDELPAPELEFFQKRVVEDVFTVILDSLSWNGWIDIFNLDSSTLTYPMIFRFDILAELSRGYYRGGESVGENLKLERERAELRKMLNDGDWVEKDSCFVQTMKIGDGDTAFPGSDIVMEYQAYFSDGQLFDDTRDWSDSMKFTLGTPMQVIPGLERSIEGMTEGTESKIIIPSQLAFGQLGSSSGLVPGYEPILYQIKIISVNKTKNETI